MRNPGQFAAMLLVAVIVGFGGYLLNHASHAYPTCDQNIKLGQLCRPLFGAVAKGNPGGGSTVTSQYDYIEKLTGRQFDVFRSYHSSPTTDTGSIPQQGNSAPPLSAMERSFAEQGKVLDINWNPALNYKDAEPVASGGTAYVNNNIAAAAKAIKSISPTPVFLSLWHETNLGANSNKPGCYITSRHGFGDTADFVKAWQNAHRIFQQQGVTNVIWTLDYSQYQPRDCQVPLLWPGSKYVDWVVYDTYDHGNGNTYASTAGRFYGVLQNFGKTDPGSGILSKPWGFGEFGTCLDTDVANSRQYYLDAANAVKKNTYPKLDMYIVFASSTAPAAGGVTGGDSCLTNYDANGQKDPVKQRNFNSLVNAIYSKQTSSSGLTLSITKPANGAAVKGVVTIGVNASKNVVRSVVAWDSTHVIRAATQQNDYGWGSRWDSIKAPNGKRTLSVTVYDTAGGSKTATITVNVDNANQTAPNLPGLSASESAAASKAEANVPAALQAPITITYQNGASLTIPVNQTPEVSGVVNVSGVGSTVSAIKVNGMTVSNSGTLNTTYLKNGVYTIELTTKQPDGRTATIDRVIVVSNHLNPWQTYRDTVFAVMRGHPTLMDVSTWASMLIIIFVAGYVAYQFRPHSVGWK